MTLSEKSRTALYVGLTELAGEEPAQEMLAHFPARDVEEAASKEFIGAAIADLRTDVNRDIAELRTEMADLRTEVKGDIAELRTEVKSDIADLRTDMAGLRTEVKSDIGRLEVALERGLRVQAAATVGAVAATLGIVSAANGLF